MQFFKNCTHNRPKLHSASPRAITCLLPCNFFHVVTYTYYTPYITRYTLSMRIVFSYRFLNNVVINTVIEMVEMVEILDGRLGQRSVERVRYVINNLLHLVIVKYGDISLVLCISTRLRLVTILSLLVKYFVIFHADQCNIIYFYVYV